MFMSNKLVGKIARSWLPVTRSTLWWQLVFVGVLNNYRPIMTETATAGLHSIAYVTVPNNDVGKTIARKIVESNLAACVNIVPQITSIYQWKGEINEDNEALLMIKTRTSRVEELIKVVKENHPYDVCEVITTKIDNGNPPYLNWISEVVPEIK